MIPFPVILPEPSNDIQSSPNAIAQRQLFAILQKSKTDLYEFNKLLQVATSSETRTQFISKIKNLEEIMTVEESRIK